MRTILLAAVLALVGCQNVVGPARRTCITEDVDSPRFTIPEQQQRGRERIGLPDGSESVGPSTDADLPSRRGVQLR